MMGDMDGAEHAASSSPDPAVRGVLRGVFGCSDDLAGQIYLRGKVRDYERRVTIVRRGDQVATLYVVVDGRAHALVYSFDGQAVLLHEYRSGDFFGAMSAPYSVTHDADVVVIDEVCAFLLDGVVLALLAEKHGCISLTLLKYMVDRLQQTASRMYEHAALSAVGRIHAEILRQARQSGDLAIRPSPILADLALRVSTTRETASRAVNALERRGIIRRDGDALVVVAPHRLEELIL